MSEIDSLLDQYDTSVATKAKTKRAGSSEIDQLLADSPPQDKGIGGHLKDAGLSLAKSAIAVPELAVGLADIPTGGAVGKALENEGGMFGFRPKQAKEILSDFHTDQYKEQQQEFSEADGIADKLGVVAENPSLVSNTVLESAAPLLAGGAVGRGVKALGAVKSPVAAGAIGEGVVSAGMQAEGIRQETDDGRLTPGQSAASVATGAATSLFGYFGGRLAQKLGIGDVDAMLSKGIGGREVAQEAATVPAKSIPRQVVEGAIQEGFLEELPQSVSETIIQNLALDRPWSDGVDESVVMGTMAGMVMGGGASGVNAVGNRRERQKPDAEQVSTEGVPDNEISNPQAEPDPAEAPETAPVKPSEKMGINPADGPISEAAAMAVDTGASSALADAYQIDEENVAKRGAQKVAQREVQNKPIDKEPVKAPEKPPEQRSNELVNTMEYLREQAKRAGWTTEIKRQYESAKAEIKAIGGQADLTLDQGAVNEETPVSQETAVQATEATDTAPKAKDQAVDIKAVISKQIPDMSDEELVKAYNHYGPDHKRAKKLEKAASKRGIDLAPENKEASASSRWDSLSPEKRGEILANGWSKKSGGLNAIGQRFSTTDFDKLPKKTQETVARFISESGNNQRPVSGDNADAGTGNVPSGTAVSGITGETALSEQPEQIAGQGGSGQSAGNQEVANDSDNTQQSRLQNNPESRARDSSGDAGSLGTGYGDVSSSRRADIEGRGNPQLNAREDGQGEAPISGVSANTTQAIDDEGYDDGDSLRPSQAQGANLTQGSPNVNLTPSTLQTESKPDQENTLRGDKVNDEFTSFSKDSGTLNIPRAEMPQVKAEHRGALANFLKGRGIVGEDKTVPAASLKPTQAEFSEAKVQKAKDFTGGDRAILASSDGHILDGHHQWMAKRDKGEDVRVIQLDAPIKQLLRAVKSFPSVEQDSSGKLTSEKSAFVDAPGGGIDFGEITPAIAKTIGRQSGKIRLPNGIQRDNGTGYGLVHIEANHGKEIRNAGFGSVIDFVSHVAKDFQQIRRSKARQLLVAVKDGREDVMYIQLEPADDGDYYRINTAFPAKRNYLERQNKKGYEVLWDGSEPTPTATEQQPLYADSPESVPGQDAPTAQGQSKVSIARDKNSQEIIEVKDLYGTNHRVSQSDLDGDKKLLTTYTKDGKRRAVKIHRENLDPDGSKKAKMDSENADNPFFDVITGKNGNTFKSETSAKAYRSKNGYANTHDPAEVTGGYVLKRKASSTDSQESPAPEKRVSDSAQEVDGAYESPNEPSTRSIAQDSKEDSSQSALPAILRTSKTKYINQEIDKAKLKKGSPGYEDAVAKIESEYEAELDKAYAGLPFEEYNALNSDTPENLNRQAWEQLRDEYGIRRSVRLTGANPSDNSETGQQARAILARNWNGDPDESAAAAIYEARAINAGPDVVDWIKVNQSRLIPGSELGFSKGDGSTETSTYTVTSLEKEINSALGGNYKALADAGLVDTVNRESLPENVKDKNTLAYVQNGKVTFVADNIPLDHDINGLVLHEIGVHLRKLNQNDNEFKSIKARFERLKAFDTKVKEAFSRVPEDTQENLITEEAIGYYVEMNPEQSTAKRFVAWFKAKLREWAKTIPSVAARLRVFKWAENLTGEDVVYMARTATQEAGKKSKDQDMSTEARMQRAVDQGYVQDVDSLYEEKVNEQGREGVVSRNAEGRLRAADKSSDNVVVGRPQTLYHGTSDDIERFDLGATTRKDRGWLGEGVYLTDRPELANEYAKRKSGGASANVLPLFARIENPYIATLQDKAGLKDASEEYIQEFTRELQNKGYDSVILAFKDVKEIVVFDPSRIRSTQAAFDPSKANSNDILYSRGGPKEWMAAAETVTKLADKRTQAAIRSNVRDRLDAVRFQLQDKLIDLKRAQEGRNAEDEANPYQKAAIWEGRAGERLNDFDEESVQPLLEQVAKTDLTLDEVGSWLVARHAEEANAYLAEINPDAPADERFRLSGMSNQEAEKILTERQGNTELQKIGEMIDKINRSRVSMLVKEGLITQGDADAWQGRYEHYVPLKREEAETADRLPARGQGFNIKGKESKQRTGSAHWTPGKIISNTIAQYEASIIRAEKNRVGKALLKFVEQNPDENFWTVDADRTQKSVRKGDLVEFDVVEETGEKLVVRYEKKDGSEVKATYKKVAENEKSLTLNVNGNEITYNKLSRNGSTLILRKPAKVIEGTKLWEVPNELSVKVNGEQRFVVFNPNNQRAMRLVTGLKNLQAAQQGSVIRAMGAFTRFLSNLNTSWNPEFLLSNLPRDLQTAAYNLSDTDISDMKVKVLRDVPGAMNGIRSALFGDGKAEWAKTWEDFRQHGGRTGWIDIHSDIAVKERNLAKAVERLREGKTSRPRYHQFIKAVEDMNTVVENAVRLSAYKNAVDRGISKERAAAMAKDLTVNFNRKGNQGQIINSMYMFFNASAQGSVRLLQAMAKSKKGRQMAVATVGFAFFLDMINRSLSGDDDDDRNIYDELPAHVKNHNIILMGKDGPIAKIPAPWGYNVLHVMGQVMGRAVTGDQFNPLEESGRLAMSMVDAFNPIGSGTFLQMLSPTVTDPFVQIGENKNFAGLPLKPEHTYDANLPRPEYQMHWQSARASSQAFTKMLNDISGGNEVTPGAINISPEWVDVVIDTLTGGAGRTITNTSDVAARLLQGKELETENIPFVRKVTGHNSDHGVKQRYYEWSQDVAYVQGELKQLRGQDRLNAMRKPERRLIGAYTGTEKRLRTLRKIRRNLESNGASDDRIEAVDKEIRSVMAKFNGQYAQVMLN